MWHPVCRAPGQHPEARDLAVKPIDKAARPPRPRIDKLSSVDRLTGSTCAACGTSGAHCLRRTPQMQLLAEFPSLKTAL